MTETAALILIFVIFTVALYVDQKGIIK